MNTSANKARLRTAILFGIAYVVVGLSLAALANTSAGRMRLMWRLAAYLVSAAAFAVHIGYEQRRWRESPVSTALYTSAGVALGAFGLAVAANVHALRAGAGNRGLLALALILWPVLTAVPAFVVAIAAAAGLSRMRPKS